MASDIGRFLNICIELAELIDTKGENGEEVYCTDLRMGYRAASAYLRRGVKEVIDLQSSYHSAIASKKYSEIAEKEAYDFLEEVFGDREAHTINDKDKGRIKAFVKSIMDEWEKGEADGTDSN